MDYTAGCIQQHLFRVAELHVLLPFDMPRPHMGVLRQKKKIPQNNQKKRARKFSGRNFGIQGVLQEWNFNPTRDAMDQTRRNQGKERAREFEFRIFGGYCEGLYHWEPFYYFRRSNPVYLTHRLRYRLSTQLVMRARTLYFILFRYQSLRMYYGSAFACMDFLFG